MTDRSNKARSAAVFLDKVIPVVENRVQLASVLSHSNSKVVMLRHCNLLELESAIVQAYQRGYLVYVNMDHVDGVHADSVGLRYLAEHMHVMGIESTNSKVLATAKALGLKTILHIYAADSTGLEGALESVDTAYIDLLDVSPALVIPYIASFIKTRVSLPFLGSGLLSNAQQLQAVLIAGATGVMVPQADFSL
jgi:glycerol uptake operon antiterminator